jgi:hypothetical protein
MIATPTGWKRLFQLLDEFFELEAPERQRWLESIADISAATKAQLLNVRESLVNSQGNRD